MAMNSANAFYVFVIFFGTAATGEVLTNPAIATKCTRMALRRVGGIWESTHLPSGCGTDSDEEAARLCKEVRGKVLIVIMFILSCVSLRGLRLNGQYDRNSAIYGRF